MMFSICKIKWINSVYICLNLGDYKMHASGSNVMHFNIRQWQENYKVKYLTLHQSTFDSTSLIAETADGHDSLQEIGSPPDVLTT